MSAMLCNTFEEVHDAVVLTFCQTRLRDNLIAFIGPPSTGNTILNTSHCSGKSDVIEQLLLFEQSTQSSTTGNCDQDISYIVSANETEPDLSAFRFGEPSEIVTRVPTKSIPRNISVPIYFVQSSRPSVVFKIRPLEELQNLLEVYVNYFVFTIIFSLKTCLEKQEYDTLDNMDYIFKNLSGPDRKFNYLMKFEDFVFPGFSKKWVSFARFI